MEKYNHYDGPTPGGAMSDYKSAEKTPTLNNDISILLARVEANEYTASRIATRLFGAQPANGGSTQAVPDVGDILEQDVLRAARSALRTAEVLQALEARLG